eukprot:GFYU01009864.1.p1 GENE.GFYU01009864.1~~GFYU01009864.1.p1  ORF type:complete len:370 (-),score=109.80 GFYU01009864.1:98-1207(-)
MSLIAMPLLILNLGSEMVYILEQRLQAQNVPPHKGKQVLQDVIRTMCNNKFTTELFKPQDIYSLKSVRQIFERLAHSSIMRLSESSMDKLFDLMTMGFKYQLMCSTNPHQIIEVTFNHLNTLKAMIDDGQTKDLIDATMGKVQSRYTPVSPGDIQLTKMTLLNFMQDRRVKVSLFLQDKIQNNDGTMVLPRGGPLPGCTDPPGVIKYLDASGNVENIMELPLPEGLRSEPANQDPAATHLGANMYSKQRPKRDKESKQTDSKHEEEAPTPSSDFEMNKQHAEVAKQELNMLAGLIGDHRPVENDNFKINLFPDTNADVGGGGGGNVQAQTIVVDGSRTNAALNDLMGGLDVAGGDDGDDDLLDLMDKAM